MSKRFGEETALDYTDYHEFETPNSECKESIMDYINNRIGIILARNNEDCKKACLNSDALYVMEDQKCLSK